ncbi:alpha/beta hydrolase [Pseudoduganella sp.]|uniref:alpha/beta hydrolase n=1 Tax=Pseudoduganella sp. TaxID=1880898 RepID=UPI0035B100E1
MQLRASLILLLPLAILGGCKTLEVQESMFIRSDAVIKAKPLPEQVFANSSKLELQRPDGVQLNGVLVTREGAERTLLYFGGNLFRMDADGKQILSSLERCKVNVAMFDYRGYGRSKGKPTVAILKEDAVAIYDMLEARTPGKVAVHGQSLGSFVAAGVAQQRPVRSVVLETPGASLMEIVHNQVPWYYKPFTTIKFAPELTVVDQVATVRQIKSPLLVMVGERDDLTPAYMGRQVFEAASQPAKQLFVLPEAGHNNVLSNPSTAATLCPFIEA